MIGFIYFGQIEWGISEWLSIEPAKPFPAMVNKSISSAENYNEYLKNRD